MTAVLDNPNGLARLNIEEIGELLLSVNQMTARLQSTHEALREQVTSLKAELAAANEQLRRSKSLAALGEMAAGIAHEIRNPLASILLDVETLGESAPADSEPAGTCTRIATAVQRLDRVVCDVLAFARDCRIHPAMIDVDDLFAAATDACALMIAKHRVQVTTRVEHSEAHGLYADENLVVQALTNLIRNSIEAITERGSTPPRIALCASFTRIRVARGRREPRITLAVEDNGPGVPPDVVKRMFNPFFTTREAGTGLGLAIVHRIIDAHGGEVDVKSLPGGGARMELRLPPRAAGGSRRDRTRKAARVETRPPSLPPVRMAG